MPSQMPRVLLVLSFVLFLLPASIASQQTGTSNDATAEVTSRAGSADTTRANAIRLEEVVVSAAGFEQAVRLAPASISRLSLQEISMRPLRNLSEAIRDLPGVDIDGTDARSNKTGNRTISLRGLPSEYTLVLINGRRQSVPGTVAPNAFDDSGAAFFPPVAAIERIEVIRGPMSTLYGSDALGGVVNIITRRPQENWRGELALDATLQTDPDFGHHGGGEFWANGPLVPGVLSLQAQARAFERQATEVDFPGRDESIDRQRTMGQLPTRGTIRTGGMELGWTPAEAHEVRLGADLTRQTYDNEFGQLGQINLGAEPGSPAYPDRLRGYDQELGFNRDQLYASHRWALGRGFWDSSVAVNATETTGRTIPSGAATEESGRRGTPRTLESRTVTVDTRYVALLGSSTVSLGGQFLDAQMTDGIPDRTFRSEQFGLFAENEWRTTDRLTLTGGARLDHHSTFGSQLSPRAYAVWAWSDTWAVKGGVARGYRAPALEQLEDGIIGFGNNGRDPLFGNPDLKPELSTNWEAGLEMDRGPGLMASLVTFRTELTDRIERPVAATGGETANIGEALLQGVELSVRSRLGDHWRVRADYTFTRSEVTTGAAAGLSEGDPLFGVPAHMLNARLAWQLSPSVEARLGGQYRSSRHRPDSFHEPHLGGSAQGATEALGDFQAYTLVDLGASWRMNERLTMNATVENLLDWNFVDYRPYSLRNDPEVTAFSNVYNNILEPRRLSLTLRAAF